MSGPARDEREWTLHRENYVWRAAAGENVTVEKNTATAIRVVPKSRLVAVEAERDRNAEASDAYEKERDWLESKLRAADRRVQELEAERGARVEVGESVSIPREHVAALDDAVSRELHRLNEYGSLSNPDREKRGRMYAARSALSSSEEGA